MRLYYVNRKRKRRFLFATILILLAVFLLIHVMSPEKGIAAWSFFDSKDELSKESQVFDFIGDIYDKVSPSVVGVSSLGGDGDPAVIGSGSGLIVSQEGYIVTNYHVIAGASTLLITLSDGRSTSGTVVGSEPENDLALLWVSLPDLSAAFLGDSDALRVGDVVFPIGNPGGEQFARSMTMGLLSGINREMLLDDGNLYLLLQTDAAINPGNSGGPLVNTKGEVVGINSVKIVDADFEGMGFAIPINTVRAFIDNLQIVLTEADG